MLLRGFSNLLDIGHKSASTEEMELHCDHPAISPQSTNKHTALLLLMETTLVMHNRFRFSRQRYANQLIVSLSNELQA